MRLAIFAGALFIGSAFAAGAQTEQSQPTQTKSTAAHPAQGGFAFSSRKCHGPIDVSSDSFEGDMQTKVGTYIGNVIMIQAECKLRADKVIAEATKGNDLDRMTAIGNVVFTSTSGTAVGDHGVYDLGDKKTITLTGKVVLTKGKDRARAHDRQGHARRPRAEQFHPQASERRARETQAERRQLTFIVP
jgi:lipopolysaccharide transport protein LptA